MTRCLFFPHDKIRAKHRNAWCLTLFISLLLSDVFPGIPYMFDRAGLDIAQEIHRNREFYRTQDVRPPFTYASLIRQVRGALVSQTSTLKYWIKVPHVMKVSRPQVWFAALLWYTMCTATQFFAVLYPVLYSSTSTVWTLFLLKGAKLPDNEVFRVLKLLWREYLFPIWQLWTNYDLQFSMVTVL